MFWCVAVLTNSSEQTLLVRKKWKDQTEVRVWCSAGPSENFQNVLPTSWRVPDTVCVCVTCSCWWGCCGRVRTREDERVRGCQRCRVYSCTRCGRRPPAPRRASRRPSECASDPGSSAASPASAAAVETERRAAWSRAPPAVQRASTHYSHIAAQIDTRNPDRCAASGSRDLRWEDCTPTCAPSPFYI